MNTTAADESSSAIPADRLFSSIRRRGCARGVRRRHRRIARGVGTAKFNIEIADTPESRAEGLMFREILPAGNGMLFVYEKPGHATFWMKNTSIPLDMIFFDFQGRVTSIHRDAVPHDTSLIDGGEDVAAALEINAGMASRLGIDLGSQIRHPSFDPQSAAWPCETGQ